MQIILEGPDGGGKSTLGNFLSQQLGLAIQHSGGPAKFPGEMGMRALRYIADQTPRIFDRHPCVSQNIYRAVLKREGDEWVSDAVLDAFYASNPIIIYCRPMKPLRDHVLSVHAEDIGHNEAVEANYAMLIRYYDEWAKEHAMITYRIGDDMTPILNAIRGMMQPNVFDPVQDVLDFHTKFSIQYTGLPRCLPEALQNFRELGMDEELNEYRDAAYWAARILEQSTFDSHYDDTVMRKYLEQQLDALVDLMYFLLGTAQLQGFDFKEAWRRVHRANMAKVRGRTKRGNSEFDIAKPPGWEAPTHADLVRNHAHVQKMPVDRNAGMIQVKPA